MNKDVKICKICRTEKSLTEFRKSGKYYQSYCRICYKEIFREWRINNHEKALITDANYRKNNFEKIKLQKQISHIKCYKANPEKFIKASLNWKRNNPKKVREIQKKSNQKRMVDPQYRLNKKMRNGIRKSLNGSKNGKHWEDLVGYSVEKLKKHLQNTLPEGYTWDDFMNGKLHIDHIIPISVFNFSSPGHLDFRRCWALNNLQLLPAKDNMVKNNKLEQSFQPSLAI